MKEILNSFPNQGVAITRNPNFKNQTHAIHINAQNTKVGNISSTRKLAFLVNPKTQKISSTIFYPSARANAADGNSIIKNGRGIIRHRTNPTFLQTFHPRELKENLNHYKYNIHNFRTQLKSGDGILFNYNFPHSIPWSTTNSRQQKHYKVSGNARKQIIESVRRKHLNNASNVI